MFAATIWILKRLGISAVLFYALHAHAGGETQNGGDAYAQAFIEQALDMANLLDTHSEDVLKLGVDSKAFHQAIASTKVTSETKLLLDGSEVDAKNYPDSHRIEISRASWDRLMPMPNRRSLLALHEYLGILKVEQNHYDASIAIGKILRLDFESAAAPLPAPSSRPSSVPDGYVQWPRGGGWVSPSALIDPSATIDSASQVGANVHVGEGVTIRLSVILDDCWKQTLGTNYSEIQKNTVIEGSSIQGRFLFESQVQFRSSTLSAGCTPKESLEIESRSSVVGSHLSHSLLIEADANVINSEVQGGEIEDHAVVRNSHLSGGVEVGDRAIVDNSQIFTTQEGQAIELESDSWVKSSTISDGSIVVENRAIVDNSTVKGKTVIESDAYVRASTLLDGVITEGAIIDHQGAAPSPLPSKSPK